MRRPAVINRLRKELVETINEEQINLLEMIIAEYEAGIKQDRTARIKEVNHYKKSSFHGDHTPQYYKRKGWNECIDSIKTLKYEP